jgi:hypothetical protein
MQALIISLGVVGASALRSTPPACCALGLCQATLRTCSRQNRLRKPQFGPLAEDEVEHPPIKPPGATSCRQWIYNCHFTEASLALSCSTMAWAYVYFTLYFGLLARVSDRKHSLPAQPGQPH